MKVVAFALFESKCKAETRHTCEEADLKTVVIVMHPTLTEVTYTL